MENKEKDIIGIIYIIINKINGKKYIGQTTRKLNDRIIDYKRGYGNDYITNAFNKYGWNNFDFLIIDTAKTIEELNSKEIIYITEYNTTNKKNGYNLESGGRNALPSIETLRKMSESHSGIVQSEEWVCKRIYKKGSDEAKKYGKKKTEEEKRYLSDHSPKFWLGKTRDEETRKKISETKKQNGLSNKQKKNICKRVYRINVLTNEIETFDSTKDASDIIGVNQSTISRWCSKDKVVDNHIWSYCKK